MSNYDLYRSIGLDSTKDSAQLAADIQDRLSRGDTSNPGGVDELNVALAILGDRQRRSRYDARLFDTTGPELDIAGLRDIAESPGESPGVDPSWAAAGGFGAQTQTPRGKEKMAGAYRDVSSNVRDQATALKGEYSRSSMKAILVTAVATALVCALVFGALFFLLGRSGSGDGNAKAEKLVSDFLDLEGVADTRDWLDEHGFDGVREEMDEELNMGNDFSGVRRELSLIDEEVLFSHDTISLLEVSIQGEGRPLRDEFERAGVHSFTMVMIGSPDTGVAEKAVMVLDAGDGPKLLYWQNVTESMNANDIREFIEDGTAASVL